MDGPALLQLCLSGRLPGWLHASRIWQLQLSPTGMHSEHPPELARGPPRVARRGYSRSMANTAGVRWLPAGSASSANAAPPMRKSCSVTAAASPPTTIK